MRVHNKTLLLITAILSIAQLPLAGFAEENREVRIVSVVLRPLQAAEVPAQQTGLLKKISVEEGQHVEENEILATLDPLEAHLAVVRARLERAQAEKKANNQISIQYAVKALEVAEAELRRSRESIEKFAKSISQSQLDVERLTVEKLMLEKQQAEHELELEKFGLQLKQTELEAAQAVLEKHRLRAPFAGAVVLIRGRVGEWVEIGAPVLRLVAVDKLRAEGFLPVEQASPELVGKRVTFVSTIGQQSMQATGELRFVSPEMDPVTRQVRVWAALDNTDGAFRPGQQGTMTIEQ
ncbi:MAG: efflux RND transporter periplasmic adaptor subunit [Planctomycetes bacterium]|nr:efflux RND transporter periplasmic adaptor subunit [Planctomycetota bacterium]